MSEAVVAAQCGQFKCACFKRLEWTNAGACFSADRAERYLLWRDLRDWNDSGTYATTKTVTATFVMLNPSIANETELDATLRRCQGFCKAWGVTRMYVVNLFSRVSTDPRGLMEPSAHSTTARDVNLAHIKMAAGNADIVIVGWGTHADHLTLKPRVELVRDVIDGVGKTAMALKTTQSGQPAHPLYLRADSQRSIYGWPTVSQALRNGQSTSEVL